MTKKLRTILMQMQNSGHSEEIAIADHLLGIAENGEEFDDEFLIGCAEELRDSTQSIIDRMK